MPVYGEEKWVNISKRIQGFSSLHPTDVKKCNINDAKTTLSCKTKALVLSISHTHSPPSEPHVYTSFKEKGESMRVKMTLGSIFFREPTLNGSGTDVERFPGHSFGLPDYSLNIT